MAEVVHTADIEEHAVKQAAQACLLARDLHERIVEAYEPTQLQQHQKGGEELHRPPDGPEVLPALVGPMKLGQRRRLQQDVVLDVELVGPGIASAHTLHVPDPVHCAARLALAIHLQWAHDALEVHNARRMVGRRRPSDTRRSPEQLLLYAHDDPHALGLQGPHPRPRAARPVGPSLRNILHGVVDLVVELPGLAAVCEQARHVART
mmetsp:Transcript_9590/g.27343  ORF Transcript_9590/g.27343 Transcript_9590/m.27343 type:complete len:207 (+) Transcript_9590:194-814(+)